MSKIVKFALITAVFSWLMLMLNNIPNASGFEGMAAYAYGFSVCFIFFREEEKK